MKEINCTAPVALFFYQRPESTRRVIERIDEVRPPAVYLVADQAPPEGDRQAVRKCRETVDGYDWDPAIEVNREYADVHYGLQERFVSGLAWLFENETEAVILEDDCIPNPSFFKFCDAMLSEYRSDERVWDVAGSNPLGKWRPERQDYHFSRFGGIWGWATWRRSWERYDPEMRDWDDPQVRRTLREEFSRTEWAYARPTYQRAAATLDTWDYPWGFSRHKHGGVSIVSSKNLVSNVGTDDRATNAVDESLVNIERHRHTPPYRGPKTVAADEEFDRAYLKARTRWWQRHPEISRVVDLGRRMARWLG